MRITRTRTIVNLKICVGCGRKKVEEYETLDPRRGNGMTFREFLGAPARGDDLEVFSMTLCPRCFATHSGGDSFVLYVKHFVRALVEHEERQEKVEVEFTVSDPRPARPLPQW